MGEQRTDLAELDGPPHLIEVAGCSMEPSIERGTRLRVVPLAGPPGIGEVLLIRGTEGWIIHRLVRRCRFPSGIRLFHAGDGGGRAALVLPEAVIGRATAAVLPADARGLALEDTCVTVRWRFRKTRIRTAVYCAVRQVAERLVLPRVRWRGLLEAVGRWML